MHVAEQLEHRLNEDTLHFATESCVFSMSSMSANDYQDKPFLSFPICDHDTLSQQKCIFEAIFTFWKEQAWNARESQQLLVNIGTDGESLRRSVLPSFRRYPLSNITLIGVP